MPDIRKLVDIGNARGISLPASWLAEEEKRLGGEIQYVMLEIVERSIIIKVEGSISVKTPEEAPPVLNNGNK